MKTNILFLFLLSLAIVACQQELPVDDYASSDSGNPLTKSDNPLEEGESEIIISKTEALKLVEYITENYPERQVDISDRIIPSGSLVPYNHLGHFQDGRDISYYKSPDYDSWLIVVEGDLSIMGPQPIKHIFVDISTGAITEMTVEGRPIIDWDSSRYHISIPDERIERPKRDLSIRPNRAVEQAKFAVIISGGTDMYNNTSCFFFDCQHVYRTLVDSLGYSRDGIFVLMSDGGNPAADRRTGLYSYDSSPTSLYGDNENDITFEATKSRLTNIFNVLKLWALPGDEVLVFMTDTGNSDGTFNMWGGEVLYPSELNYLLNKLGQDVMIDVVLGQSYSGAFISGISGTNRTITTSSSSTEIAYRNTYNYTYFLNKWTSYISDYVSGSASDVFNDAFATPAEVFNSASSWIQSHYSQHPQFNSTPSSFGDKHSLSGEPIPEIVGPGCLSVTSSSYYTLDNAPVPSLVSWYTLGDAMVTSFNANGAYVKGNILASNKYYSSNAIVVVSMIYKGKEHKIAKRIDSVWKPGQYMNYHLIQGGSGFYWIGTGPSEITDYYWESSNSAWQIYNQLNNYVYVSEGYTNDPVYLMVTFTDPFGGSIFVLDQVL